MSARAPGAPPPTWGALLLVALCICPSAGCAGDAPASASTAEPLTQLPPPSPATEEEPAPGESSSEPAEMSSSEPAEASSNEPAEAHSAGSKPVIHHHHRRKRKPRPAPAATVSKPAPAHTAAPPAPKPTSNIHPIGPEDTVSVLGKMVVDTAGNELGRVVNVLMDAKSHVRAVVIDFGGFLGVGNRQIAVNWDLLEFHPGAGDKSLVLKVSRDQVENAPSFQESAHPEEVEGPAHPAAAAPAAATHPAAPAPAAPPHPTPPAPAHSGK